MDVSSGVTSLVSSGTTVSGAVVLSGGILEVLSGGSAASTTVLDGGWLQVSGTASGTVLSSGASETVFAGGTSLGDVVSAGGFAMVSSGGSTSGSLISGGTEFAQTAATVSGAQVAQGALVISGGTASGTTVSSGGYLLLSAGFELGGVISGGTEIVRDFSYAVSPGVAPVIGFDVIEAGGYQVLYQGTAYYVTVAAGGVQILGGGGAQTTSVGSGGTQVISADSVAVDDTVASGGVVSVAGELLFDYPAGNTVTLNGEIVGDGAIVQSAGGTLVLAAEVASAFDDPGWGGALSIAGGTVVLTSAGAAGSGTIGFAAGTSGTLVIDGTTMPVNTISGLAAGDVIDLAGVAYGSGGTARVSGNVVTISTGGSVFLLTIAGAANDGAFALSKAADGSTRLTDTVHSTNVSSGTTSVISAGQTVSRLVALSGGMIVVQSGGTSVSAAALSGGSVVVAGGVASGTVLSSGAIETISSHGIGIGEAISAGATETVSSGGTTSAALVTGGTELLMSASVASRSLVTGGVLLVSGGHASATTIANGGFLLVSSGLASGDLVSGGEEMVQTLSAINGSHSAVVSGSVVEAGGYEYVFEGLAAGVAVAASGTQVVAGGTASATSVGNLGLQVVSAGGLAVNDLVAAGGSVMDEGQLRFVPAVGGVTTLGGQLAGSGAIVQAGGGTLKLAATVVGSLGAPGFTGALSIASGTVEITSAGAAGTGAIGFAAGGSGTLRIDGSAMPANLISGFVKGDVIDLSGVAFARPASATVSGNTVTIAVDGPTYSLTIAGAAQDGIFTVAQAPDGSTVLTDSATISSVSSGVTSTVSSGVLASDVAVLSGGTLVVLSGGTAGGTVLSSGASEVIRGGGAGLGEAVSAGGYEIVSAGGSIAGDAISGGTAVLQAGAGASGTLVAQGALVVSGGVASATGVASGGYLVISAGAAADDVVSGGTEMVRDLFSGISPGVAPIVVSDLVDSGGTQYLVQGSALDATVEAGGVQVVEGGSAIATSVGSGGTQLVSAGAVATDDLVTGGGVVAAAGELDFTEFAAAMITLGGRLTGSGVILQSGAGVLVLAADVSSAADDPGFGGALSIADGTIELASAGAAGSGGIGFAVGSIGTLAIDGTIMPGNTLFDIAPGDVIDLHGVVFNSGATVSTTSGNVLTVSEPGGMTELLQLDPAQNLSHLFFTLTREAAGTGTVITTFDPPCYCRGTRVLTAGGEVPVEHLAIGDRVVTWSGALAPVRWLGRRSYAGRHARFWPGLWPIRIRAGALADGVPRRDLFVSPCHALFLDGCLVPAGALENGVSIWAEEDWALIEYFHVELSQHDVIWAEGAPAESFVDDRSRTIFENAADHAGRYPDAAPGPARYCAPRLREGAALHALRRRLAERAGIVPPELRGFVDEASPAGLQGWAQDPDHPEVAVCLDILLDGAVATRTLANRYRPDLAQAGLGSGRHAFDVALPEAARWRGASIAEVRRSSDGVALGRSPWRLVA